MTMIEIRARPAPDLEVPEIFARLRDVAYNLWWSWSPAAHQLFDRLAPATWRHYRNPIDVLIDLGPERWDTLQSDPDFTREYQALVESFDRYMAERETWFARQHAGYGGGPFAYFSMEFGWHECLQIYSGGLGVLSGDHCKSASDLGLPFVGVGLMYKRGYFRQTIDSEGLQQHFYPDFDLRRLPILPVVDSGGHELHVTVEFPGRDLRLRVWRASVGRVPVLLLDSDLPINHPADRPITSILYVHGREMRLCQEIALGLGGARALAALGIEPAVWHMNEGHSALLILERVRDLMEQKGVPFEEALRRTEANTVFTTHTPVPAGNEVFDAGLVRKYLASWSSTHGLDVERLLQLGRASEDPADTSFNLTALALRACARANGVSRLHGEVANRNWHVLLERYKRPPIEQLTNGVHLPSWVGPEIGGLLQKQLGPGFGERLLDPGFVEAVEAIPDHELWHAHQAQKQRLIRLVRNQQIQQSARHGRSPDELRALEDRMNPDVLTVGFARRFATYKRADLILRDMEQLRALLADAERPLQLIFAGMAHPADRPGQELIRRICQAALLPELHSRMTFIESYDMQIGRQMVQGVDLWLNTPRRPNEASGTSGMKAAMNGVLNCSILDGWWCEGFDPQLGWAIGEGGEGQDDESRDRSDAQSLYRVLAETVRPLYYERNAQGLAAGWIRMMKSSIARLSPRFSTARMVREYAERYYLPAASEALDPTGYRSVAGS